MFHGRSWSIVYATALSVVCAAILATLNAGLLGRITLNRANERHQIILGCFGVGLGEGATGAEIKAAYEKLIEERTVTLDDGTEVPYYALVKDGKLDAVAIEIDGIGLWSYIHGYVAIEASDFNTIRQVNFDKQEETPGLGGEIVSKWFRAQFPGKSVMHDGEPVRHMVAKPGQAKPYQVDGISGATVTSVAVSDMLYRGFVHVAEIAETLEAETSKA